MKTYVGIDPGKTGAIAILHLDEVCFIEPQDLERDPSLIDFIEVFVAIEKAQAMPKQGVVSMFHYGVSYGTMIGILKALRKPYQEISPRTWKKEFSLTNDKKESVVMAVKLFPGAAGHLKFKKDHGKAEALLLAEYARRKNM
jgi:hypothetical protein